MNTRTRAQSPLDPVGSTRMARKVAVADRQGPNGFPAQDCDPFKIGVSDAKTVKSDAKIGLSDAILAVCGNQVAERD